VRLSFQNGHRIDGRQVEPGFAEYGREPIEAIRGRVQVGGHDGLSLNGECDKVLVC